MEKFARHIVNGVILFGLQSHDNNISIVSPHSYGFCLCITNTIIYIEHGCKKSILLYFELVGSNIFTVEHGFN